MNDEELKFWTTPPNLFLVAETESGNIAGCISYQEITPDAVEINRLSVDFRFRKLGIGQKLVETLIRRAKENGYDTIYLETWPRPVEAMYKKMKFKFLREKPDRSPIIDFFTGVKLLCYIYRAE